MTESIIYSAIAGFILPFIANIVNKKITNSKAKYIIALVLSIITGLIVVLATGQIKTVEGILAAIGLVFAVSQTAFKTLYKNAFGL